MRVKILALSIILVFITLPVQAAPGSGTATVSPAADVTVGALGTWAITYTAVDTFANGTVRVTAPVNWTAPQDVSPSGAGYVTVSSSDGDANPSLSISGHQITISLAQVDSAATVTLVYGDDSGGANPGARVESQTIPESNVEFTVESDPLGSALQSSVPRRPSTSSQVPSPGSKSPRKIRQLRRATLRRS